MCFAGRDRAGVRAVAAAGPAGVDRSTGDTVTSTDAEELERQRTRGTEHAAPYRGGAVRQPAVHARLRFPVRIANGERTTSGPGRRAW